MREGVKIVVAIMVALIIAFALIFVFSERLLGTNETILQPTEEESGHTISVTMCKTIHGDDGFLISGTDCPTNCSKKGYLEDSSCNPPAVATETCCCKCKDSY